MGIIKINIIRTKRWGINATKRTPVPLWGSFNLTSRTTAKYLYQFLNDFTSPNGGHLVLHILSSDEQAVLRAILFPPPYGD